MALSRAEMSKKFAIATAAAEKQGFRSFKKGSPGADKRKHIAEAIGRKLSSKGK